jgi:hypothetical protein
MSASPVGITDQIAGWVNLSDTDSLQIGDTVRITVSFDNIPGFGPDSTAISQAFLEYADLTVASVTDIGSMLPGFDQWQIVGSMLDNCTSGTTKGQVYNAMSSVSGLLAVPLLQVSVVSMEAQVGSPSVPNPGIVGGLANTLGVSQGAAAGSILGLGTFATLAVIAVIVIGAAYLTGPGFFARKAA